MSDSSKSLRDPKADAIELRAWAESMRVEFAVAEPILLAHERRFTPQQNWEMLRTFLAEFDGMGLKLPEDMFMPWKGDLRFPLL